MKIFIDFDDVIFNTGKFKEDFLNKVFIKNGATQNDFTKTYYHFFKKNGQVDKYYDPKKQIEALGKKDYINGDKLEKDFNALWPLRNKATPRHCSPFLRWRMDDYLNVDKSR